MKSNRINTTRWLAYYMLAVALIVFPLISSAQAKKVKPAVQDNLEDVIVDQDKYDEIFPEEPASEAPPTVEADPPSPEEEEDPILYATPKPPMSSYIAEHFDDIVTFDKNWVRSQAKKDGVDVDLAKYDGVWALEEPQKPILKGDRALVLKSKAKHAAIAAPLSRPFKFGAKPFVVQYEVTLQEGQECGGGYIKLLSMTEGQGSNQLKQFQDRTPYSIMFGPDNCGKDYKLHFIFRHVNPLDGTIEEKHAKRSSAKLEKYFKDNSPHLFQLLLRPDNTFEMSIDHNVINSGNLLEDVSPPVNPDKDIADPDDFKPENWDEREKIPDPDDKKPEDWDDDASKKIPDQSASIPSGWLEEEPEMIPDPEAVKPDDWDNGMDGEWEAPLINNPVCEGIPGCGPWSRPSVDNPGYKGKWFPKQIANPNYRGTWVARVIPNPHYFEDLEPFKMTPISAVGFELWTMSENVLFDNVLISDSIDEARQFAADTFDLKISKMERGKGNIFQRALEYSNERPWLYGIYVIGAAIPVVFIIMCCCYTSSAEKTTKTDDSEESSKTKDPSSQAQRKKTDATTEDDPPSRNKDEEEEEDNEDEEDSEDDDDVEAGGESEENQGESNEDEEGKSSQEEEAPAANANEEKESQPQAANSRPRRRARKDQ